MKEPNFADAVMHLRKTPADETNAKKYVSLKQIFKIYGNNYLHLCNASLY